MKREQRRLRVPIFLLWQALRRKEKDSSCRHLSQRENRWQFRRRETSDWKEVNTFTDTLENCSDSSSLLDHFSCIRANLAGWVNPTMASLEKEKESSSQLRINISACAGQHIYFAGYLKRNGPKYFSSGTASILGRRFCTASCYYKSTQE